MRKSRFMTLFFLALALAFFFLRDFRAALRVPFLNLGRGPYGEGGAPGFPTREVDRYIRWAEARNDAPGMLFGAFQLQASNRTHAMELLDKAVARDPKLAWAYLQGAWEAAEEFETSAWRERAFRYADLAIAHAPDNAAGYLGKAEFVRRATLGRDLAAHTGKGLDRLSATPEWIVLMRKATAQPRFDTYAMDLYRLQAKIWREQHWDTFLLGSWQLAGYSIPSAANLVDYDSLVTDQFGPALARAGKVREARAMYLEVARLGQQMQLNPGSLIMYLVGLRLTPWKSSSRWWTSERSRNWRSSWNFRGAVATSGS